jgi:hypothetical protein
MRLFALALALVAVTVPGSALADGVVRNLMTQADKARLENYDATRKAALAEARTGDPAAIEELDAVLSRPLVPFSDQDIAGDWRCRTIKLGGIAKLVIYGWFKCRVSDDGSGWQLTKRTGSQRTQGRLYDDGEKRAIYLGSFFIAGQAVKPYGSGAETDQAGYAFRSGPDSWRIEFPAPYYESKLDIIELAR